MQFGIKEYQETAKKDSLILKHYKYTTNQKET